MLGLDRPAGRIGHRGDCATIVSPPAIWRLAEAVLVLGAVAVLAVGLRAPAASLYLRWPSVRVIEIAALGFGLSRSSGSSSGPALAEPFFGAFRLDLSQPGALAPALVFALANGIMEESPTVARSWAGRHG